MISYPLGICHSDALPHSCSAGAINNNHNLIHYVWTLYYYYLLILLTTTTTTPTTTTHTVRICQAPRGVKRMLSWDGDRTMWLRSLAWRVCNGLNCQVRLEGILNSFLRSSYVPAPSRLDARNSLVLAKWIEFLGGVRWILKPLSRFVFIKTVWWQNVTPESRLPGDSGNNYDIVNTSSSILQKGQL